MTRYHIRNKHMNWYGESIGILILEASYPCIPGNVGNASTFDFPVRYSVVKGASIDRLLNQKDKSLAKPFIDAALKLQDEGVKAITGACGFMVLFQEQIKKALDIPVFMSSLMQLPFISGMIQPVKKTGIITANKSSLTQEHLYIATGKQEINLVVYGMEDQDEFRTSVLEEKGSLDSDKIKHEILGVTQKMMNENPELGAILLECSDLPPYAKDVQDQTGLPVFDFITMINYVNSVLIRQNFSGYM